MAKPDFGAWDRALRRHVAPGVIGGIGLNALDYAGMATDPDYKTFLASIENVDTQGLPKSEAYALYINAYNALAVKMVVENPCKKAWLGSRKPISSIKDIGTMVSPVWKRTAGILGGASVSLDDIEHERLRKPEGLERDPLLHACIVCASVSCPDLAASAYLPTTLEQQMADNMRAFLANPAKGMALDRGAGVLRLSKIFSWFESDFVQAGGGGGTVVDFLLPYMPSADSEYVGQNKGRLKVDFFYYDWNLNGRGPPCK
ncbi:unnamed protein product [Phaeothamnion confervicola]